MISPELREKCNLNSTKVKFVTHSQLDLFVKNIRKSVPQFAGQQLDHNHMEIRLLILSPEKHPEDYSLLKSFDRAFWLKHYSAKNRFDETKDSEVFAQKKLLFQHCDSGCAFGNPGTNQEFR